MEGLRYHSRWMFRSTQLAASQGITPHRLLFLFSAVFPGGAAQPGAESTQNPYGLGSNFNPSMGIIIVVLVCSFFFMGFFSIYVRQCVETRAAGGADASAVEEPRRRTQTGGVDASVIDALPVFMYSDVKFLKIGKGALECAVCLNEFEDDETLRLLPKCDHVFHSECIDTWFFAHVTCPVCRSNLTHESTEFITNCAAINETQHSNNEFESENTRSETTELQNQVSIDIHDDQSIDPQFPEPKQLRATGKFPRSHSTGHLVQQGENCERFTLKLPEEVRRQIENGELQRTKSCTILRRDGSCRRSYRNGGGEDGGGSSSRGRSYQNVQVGFGRSGRVEKMDRWVVSLTPPFFSRAGSSRSPKGGVGVGVGGGSCGEAAETLGSKTVI